jgi:hypothetical protein
MLGHALPQAKARDEVMALNVQVAELGQELMRQQVGGAALVGLEPGASLLHCLQR